MNKKFKSFTAKCLSAISALTFFLTTLPSQISATNNPTASKVNAVLEDFQTDNIHNEVSKKDIIDYIYSRLRLARERNYSSKLTGCSPIFDISPDKKDVFEKIYDSNFWGSKESRSGPGSEIKSTRAICEILPKLFEKYGIKSILDAPCGDYNWMKRLKNTGVSYIGGDIVPKIIKNNNKNYKNKNTSFKVMDITADKLPKADMIFCRDCLQHLSNEDVKKAIRNFKKSGSKYLLVTNYLLTLENYDIKNGDFRALNLCQKPFNMSSYIERFKEDQSNGNCIDKYLYLYKIDDIDLDQFDSEKIPKNIPIAMALDENYTYPTAVSMTSIMENSNSKVQYDFYIMHSPTLSTESKKILTSFEQKYKNCTVKLIDMESNFDSAHTDSRITTPAYYRLMLSDLLPNLDKIIWIDGDTIVYEDLVDMINIDMDGYCYKAFLDWSFLANSLKCFDVSTDHYVCDGVMIINLDELRKENAVDKFNDFIKKHNDKLVQHDQTVINAVFTDKIGILPAKFGIWNLPSNKLMNYENLLVSPEKYTHKELVDAQLNPAIRHVTRKPWKFPHFAPEADKWWQYAQKTDIFEKIKQKYFIADGIYTIVSALDSEKVLEISGGSKKQKAALRLQKQNNKNSQKFKVTYDKNGYYTIEALCSGKMIDVPHSSKKCGTGLWQYTNNDTDAQKWYILPNNDGTYQIISKCNGMNMDVRGSNTKNGTSIRCLRSNNTYSQKFKFVKLN